MLSVIFIEITFALIPITRLELLAKDCVFFRPDPVHCDCDLRTVGLQPCESVDVPQTTLSHMQFAEEAAQTDKMHRFCNIQRMQLHIH